MASYLCTGVFEGLEGERARGADITVELKKKSWNRCLTRCCIRPGPSIFRVGSTVLQFEASSGQLILDSG